MGCVTRRNYCDHAAPGGSRRWTLWESDQGRLDRSFPARKPSHNRPGAGQRHPDHLRPVGLCASACGAGAIPDGWRVRDLRSSNGTFINGARVTTLAKLQPGDSIVMGRARLTLLADNDSVGPEPTMRPASEVDRVGLTSRETEVLRLVAAGRSDAQIAQRIFISVRTVHSHLEHIRNKTGVRRRTELARYAVTLGLSE